MNLSLNLLQARLVFDALTTHLNVHPDGTDLHAQCYQDIVEYLDKNTPYGLTITGSPATYPHQKFPGIFGGPVRQHNCWINDEELVDALQAAIDEHEYLFDPEMIGSSMTAADWQEGYDAIEHLIEMAKGYTFTDEGDDDTPALSDQFNRLVEHFETEVEQMDDRL